jgi:bifunctional enzyme CysN/CysC/sulfate adenylyltransferase subunit 1
MVVWLHENPLEIGKTYLVKHTTRQTKTRALRICHRVNVNTFEREPATKLNMNDIASVEFEAHVPLFFHPYAINRTTGSFILIDAISNATVGAGMIDNSVAVGGRFGAPEVARLDTSMDGVAAQERYARHGHYPGTFLLDDRPALASRLERALFQQGFEVVHLDDHAASSDVLLKVIRATHTIGAVFIYSGHLNAETKEQLASEARAQLFDTSRDAHNFDDEELLRRALALASSLRLETPAENRHKAN